MARPTTYMTPRVDTKVRLREDHRKLLEQAVIERNLGRNRIIEQALDQFFGLVTTQRRPKLAKADPAQNIQGGPRTTKTRHSPSLHKIGEQQAEASQAAVAAGLPVAKSTPAKTRRQPRRPM